MSHLRLGLQVFIRDTRENPELVLSALVAFVLAFLVFTVITGAGVRL